MATSKIDVMYTIISVEQTVDDMMMLRKWRTVERERERKGGKERERESTTYNSMGMMDRINWLCYYETTTVQ